MNKIPCEICATLIPVCSRRYGGISCNSCAGFFKRSILINKDYVCTNSDNCFKESVDLGKGCRKCRYAKCLEIGMTSYELMKKLTPSPTILEQCMYFSQVVDTVLTLQSQKIKQLFETSMQKSDETFIEAFTEAINKMEINLASERTFSLTFLLLKSPIKAEELSLFCYICACNLEIKFLMEEEDLVKFKLLQSISFRRLTTANFKNMHQRFEELSTLSQHFLNIFYSFF